MDVMSMGHGVCVVCVQWMRASPQQSTRRCAITVFPSDSAFTCRCCRDQSSVVFPFLHIVIPFHETCAGAEIYILVAMNNNSAAPNQRHI